MPASIPAATYDIRVEEGIVVVDERGELDLPFTQRVAQDAMREAASAGTWWLLFDFTQAHVRDYHSLAVEHGDHAIETGLARFRIALVGRAGDPMLMFFETVGLNRGVTTKAFATREEAKRWLRG